MENADFAGRVAVVTGAGRGLGRAAAARLHERGASVAVNVRDRERAEAMAKKIGERAFAVPGDVTAAASPTRSRGARLNASDGSTSWSTTPRFRCRHASPISPPRNGAERSRSTSPRRS